MSIRQPLFMIGLFSAFFSAAGDIAAANPPEQGAPLSSPSEPVIDEPPPAPLLMDVEVEPPPAALQPPPEPIISAASKLPPSVSNALLPLPTPPKPLAVPATPRPRVPTTPRPRVPAPAPAPVDDRRQVHGHRFLPSELLHDPFATTYLGTFTAFSYGQGSAVLPADQEGNTQQLSRQQAGFAHGLVCQVGILSGWALRASVRLHVRSGINVDTLAERGTDFLYSISGGTVGSLRIGRWIRLGGAVDADYTPDYNVNIVQPVRKLLNPVPKSVDELADRIDQLRQQLLKQQSALTVTARGLLAVAPHRSVGMLFELNYAHSFSFGDGPVGTPTVSLGGALSFDLGALAPVPLGLLLGYRLDLPTVMDAAPLAHNLSGGLFYTGRPHLALGIDVTMRLDEDAANSAYEMNTSGTFLMRYYW